MFHKTIFSFFFVVFSQGLFAQNSLPNLSLKNLDGQSVQLATYSKNKTIVFSFWATWCVPCINELDAISEDYEDLKESLDFELVAVSVDDARTKSRVKPLINGKGWDYLILLDSNQQLKRALNITSVPYIIIVKDGKIVYSHSGYTPGGEKELYKKLKSLQ